MAEYHTVYKGPEGETTQWDDIQRKLGNLAPLEPVEKPENFAPEQEVVKDNAFLDDRDEEELDHLEDAFADDRELEKYRCVNSVDNCRLGVDNFNWTMAYSHQAVPWQSSCTWRPTLWSTVCVCRQQRVQEMKNAINRPRFGTLEMIRAPEFQQKVTNASSDVWVVVLLFKEECAAACFLL